MLQVRNVTYRDKMGFSCSGNYQNKYYKIFFTDKGHARDFVDRLKSGEKSEVILNGIWKIGIKNKAEGR